MIGRFVGATTKYDSKGFKIPKGLNQIKNWRIQYPDRIIFDSRAEYLLYLELSKMQTDGRISDLKLQVQFDLVEGIEWFNNIKGKNEKLKGVTYIADFTYTRDGNKYVADCKGWSVKSTAGKKVYTVYYDDVYKIKKKLFLNKYPEYIFVEY